MRDSNFLTNFINALYQKIKKRSQLVSFISETLEIERESASRRLNGSVNFSVEEMGILSLKLGISLDGLLFSNGEHFHFPSFTMYSPMQAKSLSTLTLGIEADLIFLSDIILSEPTEYGSMFTFLPLHFLMPYHSLLKFIYFKWGYYYMGTADFDNYGDWEIPKDLSKLSDKTLYLCSKVERMTYIWDCSAIWSFVNDIMYFASIGSLNNNDLKLIKDDLHSMLYQFEEMLKGTHSTLFGLKDVEIYISEVSLGACFSYHISKDKWCSNFHTYFVGTGYNEDYNTTMQLRDWMNSMKKICSLISGSGIRERKRFFYQQHNIVDRISAE